MRIPVATLAFLLVAGSIPAAEPALEGATRHFVWLTPTVAGGGAVSEPGYRILADAGIRTIIDLRDDADDVAAARAEAHAAGQDYFNLPIGREAPSPEVVERFGELMEHADAAPVYFHCVSGARAGTLWAIYRRGEGASVDQAIEEGRRVGLSEARESQVRDYQVPTSRLGVSTPRD
ncbi:MAG: sulfur transferase domain-containing protein [Gammaproteobacteria bacterium]|jgi:uncharacterized protein (TIGR01244 family)